MAWTPKGTHPWDCQHPGANPRSTRHKRALKNSTTRPLPLARGRRLWPHADSHGTRRSQSPANGRSASTSPRPQALWCLWRASPGRGHEALGLEFVLRPLARHRNSPSPHHCCCQLAQPQRLGPTTAAIHRRGSGRRPPARRPRPSLPRTPSRPGEQLPARAPSGWLAALLRGLCLPFRPSATPRRSPLEPRARPGAGQGRCGPVRPIGALTSVRSPPTTRGGNTRKSPRRRRPDSRAPGSVSGKLASPPRTSTQSSRRPPRTPRRRL
mmetsp:Transcript_123430/g.348753  ORF Transcript_123430/g.348753 Transcript_123430/m.348753 type:complete len:268 (-) Transcript_123430:516-1319(-)